MDIPKNKDNLITINMDTEPKEPVCRVCLSADKKNISIFHEHKNLPIYLHINSLSNIHIKEGDGFPNIICTSCLLDLDTAIGFKEKCESSDLFLRTIPYSQSSLVHLSEDNVKYMLIKKEEPQFETEDLEVTESYSEPDTSHNDYYKEVKPKTHENYKPAKNPFNEISLNIGSQERSGKNSESNLLKNNNCDNEAHVYLRRNHDRPSKKPNKVELGLRESRAIDLQLQCDDCKEYFKSKCKLRVHWKKVHLTEALKCLRCKRSFKSYKAYNTHKQNGKKVCIEAEKFRIEVESKKRCFYCKECDYKTQDLQVMVRHRATHTGDKPFKCNVCSKSFSQKGSLIRHREFVHQMYKKQVACPHCGKLTIKSAMNRHLQIHKNERFPCSICQKELKSKATLKLHIARHSGDKSVTCEICAQTFYTNTELSRHKQHTHYKIRNSYNCDMCNYKCHTSQALCDHKVKHKTSKYMCGICGYFFKKFETFTLHKKQHFEEKRYACPFCDAKYHNRNSKNTHIRKHHGFLSGESDKKSKLKIST